MNGCDVMVRLKAEIDDALGIQFEEPWQRRQFAGFVRVLIDSKIEVHEFPSVALDIGLGRAYDHVDLLESRLSEVLLGLSEAERAELDAHYETRIERMGRKYPDLIC